MSGRPRHATEDPIVSVVIPTHDYGEFLPASVASACRQTLEEIEIIIVDDGSTDGTEAVVGGFADPRIRYIRTPHRGNYFARNRGIEESRGEFIAFLDADDVWIDPDKLRHQIEVLRRKPPIGLCFSSEYIHEEVSGRTWVVKTAFRGSTEDQSEIWEVLSTTWCINSSSVVVRRSCLDAVGNFDTAHHNAMDVDLWSRILFRFDGYYDDRRLVVRRRHGRNHSLNPAGRAAVDYAFTKLLADEGARRRLTQEQRALFLDQRERIMARPYTTERTRHPVTVFFSPPWFKFPFRFARRARRVLRMAWRRVRTHRETTGVTHVLCALAAGPPACDEIARSSS